MTSNLVIELYKSRLKYVKDMIACDKLKSFNFHTVSHQLNSKENIQDISKDKQKIEFLSLNR